MGPESDRPEKFSSFGLILSIRITSATIGSRFDFPNIQGERFFRRLLADLVSGRMGFICVAVWFCFADSLGFP